MKIYSREEIDKIYDDLFDNVKKDWFKTEVLQYYEEDDSESLREYLSGNKDKALKLLDQEVKDLSWSIGDSKTKKTRIHIVELPLSQYLEYEIEFYKRVNIPKVGEEIYLVDKNLLSHLEIPDGDFNMFDKKAVVKNIYSEKGLMTHAELYGEGDNIEKFLFLRDELMRFSLPLGEFLSNNFNSQDSDLNSW